MSQEMSTFAKLFATSYLLYGGKVCRQSRDGEFGEISELKAFSAESELPRLEMIDPEGSIRRRHHALESVRELDAMIAAKEQASDA
jgi:hypothetical protein